MQPYTDFVISAGFIKHIKTSGAMLFKASAIARFIHVINVNCVCTLENIHIRLDLVRIIPFIFSPFSIIKK